MSFKPHGIVVPIVTPVDQEGRLNEKAYRGLVDYLADNGIHGVFPFGTTGEFYAYDQEFYNDLLALTKEAVAGRMQIYAGANHITTKGAIAIARAVEKVGGIDALSVLTPMFVSQTQEEVYTSYKAIAAETSLPIMPSTGIIMTNSVDAFRSMENQIDFPCSFPWSYWLSQRIFNRYLWHRCHEPYLPGIRPL